MIRPEVELCCTVYTSWSPQHFPNQKGWDTSSEMVKIISDAQHILWAQAILLCLPPGTFHQECISKYRKDHFCQEPKWMKSFLYFQESWMLWKTILCSIFELISISMATWGRSGCSGQLPCRERDERWQGHKLKQTSILSSTHATNYAHWHHQDSHTGFSSGKCHNETEITK